MFIYVAKDTKGNTLRELETNKDYGYMVLGSDGYIYLREEKKQCFTEK